MKKKKKEGEKGYGYLVQRSNEEVKVPGKVVIDGNWTRHSCRL